MYVKIKDGVIDRFPYTPSDLMRDNPTISFPHYPSDSLLTEFGMHKVTERNMPTYDRRTQTIKNANTPDLIDGSWTLGWVINQKTDEEIALYDVETENFIRSERDRLLRETDWMALSDTVMTESWAIYRQKLRDVTQQAGFPDNITWPTKPE